MWNGECEFSCPCDYYCPVDDLASHRINALIQNGKVEYQKEWRRYSTEESDAFFMPIEKLIETKGRM